MIVRRPRRFGALWTLGAMLPAVMVLAGCGGASDAHHRTSDPDQHGPATTAQPSLTALSIRTAVAPPDPQALVTAETENQLVVVDLARGRVVRRIAIAADPENVAVGGGVVVVVSSRTARVTVLERRSMRVLRVLGGFQSPHIPAISPDGRFAYVTDDARGTLTAISLRTLLVTDTIAVGSGAHHVAFSPDGRQAWIALGESTRTIVRLDTADAARPRIAGRFDPGFAAHDLAFSPNGTQVWIGSARAPDVVAFSARDHRLLFRVAVGAGPQHLVFAGRFAYLTSGYGGTIERVLASNGTLLARAAAPYGSFELDAGHGVIAASSLLRGTLAVFDPRLRLLRILAIAPAARDLVISAL